MSLKEKTFDTTLTEKDARIAELTAELATVKTAADKHKAEVAKIIDALASTDNGVPKMEVRRCSTRCHCELPTRQLLTAAVLLRHSTNHCVRSTRGPFSKARIRTKK